MLVCPVPCKKRECVCAHIPNNSKAASDRQGMKQQSHSAEVELVAYKSFKTVSRKANRNGEGILDFIPALALLDQL